MLTLTIGGTELWDEVNNIFIQTEGKTITLEHSLVTLAKWEAKWRVPFLNGKEKSAEQTLDYIRCMTLTPGVDEQIYLSMTQEQMDKINEYLEAPMTATYISETLNERRGREIVTAELIYYWMIALTIPFECENWHLNRLLMLVKVCNVKNQPKKKTNRKALISRNAALNAERRRKLGTKG